MKNFKGFALGLVVGLALAISSIGFAQTSTQNDPAKEKAAACCGESCCMQHAAGHDPKKHAEKEGCCCCSGDSCDMKIKEQQKENKQG